MANDRELEAAMSGLIATTTRKKFKEWLLGWGSFFHYQGIAYKLVGKHIGAGVYEVRRELWSE